MPEEQAYLWGLDLFNHGFYWEAHEVWEGLWKRAVVGSWSRYLLQGLIQTAASMLKALCAQWPASQTLASKALAKFTKAIEFGGPQLAGLDVARLRDALLHYVNAMNSAALVPRMLLKTAV